MSLFASNDEKARKALEAATSHHAMAIAELEAVRLASADAGDFAQLKAQAEKTEVLERDAGIAAGVVEHWKSVVAKLEAEATAKAAIARNAEMDRRARAAVKRVASLFATIETLRPELEWLAGHIKEFDHYNSHERGNLPFVADAERRLRERPGDMVPARVDEFETWADADGNPVRDQITDNQGRWRWNPDAKQRKTVRQVISDAYQLPPKMPRRVIDDVRLVDVEGRVIWGG